MLVDETNPNRFYFFMIFRDEKANEAHWETDVFKAWWNTVEELFGGGLSVSALCVRFLQVSAA
jgi:autoinducer 2-degrading protein